MLKTHTTPSLMIRFVENLRTSVIELPVLLHTPLPELCDQLRLSSSSYPSALYCF